MIVKYIEEAIGAFIGTIIGAIFGLLLAALAAKGLWEDIGLVVALPAFLLLALVPCAIVLSGYRDFRDFLKSY